MNNIIRTQIRLPESMHQEVCSYAEYHCVSMNKALIEVIEKGMKRAPLPVKVSEALKLIASAIGNQHEQL